MELTDKADARLNAEKKKKKKKTIGRYMSVKRKILLGSRRKRLRSLHETSKGKEKV